MTLYERQYVEHKVRFSREGQHDDTRTLRCREMIGIENVENES